MRSAAVVSHADHLGRKKSAVFLWFCGCQSAPPEAAAVARNMLHLSESVQILRSNTMPLSTMNGWVVDVVVQKRWEH